jgi:RNA-binding protein 25
MSFVCIRGRELQRRLAEREKEIEQDGRDRQREKEELEELKNKIFSEEHDDPSAEFERVSTSHLLSLFFLIF